MKRLTAILSVILVTCIVVAYTLFMGRAGRNVQLQEERPAQVLPASPLSATYNIAGVEVELVDGTGTITRADETERAVTVVGAPALGDLNNDDIADAALVLSAANNAGAEQFLAVALGSSSGFVGLHATRIEDRPISVVAIENGVALLTYASESGAGTSTANGTAAYFTLVDMALVHLDRASDDRVVFGTVRETHDAVMFTSCDGMQYTVASSSRAFTVISTIMRERGTEATSTAPFLTLVVRTPADEQSQVIVVLRVLSAPQRGVCPAPRSPLNTSASSTTEAVPDATASSSEDSAAGGA